MKTIIGVLLMILFLHVLLFYYHFLFYFIYFFGQNHLTVTSDEIICTGYTILANECTYSEIIAKINGL